MSGSRAFASLSSSLLARKGGARPAMRSALTAQSDGRPHDPLADLGWNDMGDNNRGETNRGENDLGEAGSPADTAVPAIVRGLEPVVVFEPAAPAAPAEPLLARKPVAAEVVQLVRETAASRPAVPPAHAAALTAIAGAPPARRTRPAAFTLRLDPERHFRLRTACALQGRSAQALVTEALDRALDDIPELAALRSPPPAQRIA